MTTSNVHMQLTLPRTLVDRISRAAAANHVSVEDVIVSSVDHVLPAVPDLPPDVLRELLAMLDFSDEALHAALRPSISAAEDRRLRELTAASKARPLMSGDAAEQARLLDLSQRSVIRRAQALAVLRRRGYQVPSMDEAFEDEDVRG